MRALLPHNALRLLSILESEGLLSVRSVAEPAAQVPAVLRRPSHSSAAKEKVIPSLSQKAPAKNCPAS